VRDHGKFDLPTHDLKLPEIFDLRFVSRQFAKSERGERVEIVKETNTSKMRRKFPAIS
jgi:hypothetical protein